MRWTTGAVAAVLMGGSAAGAAAQTPEGDWIGVMKTPTLGDLTMAVHLRRDGGGYAGTVDDITLGARGMAASDIVAGGDRLAFAIPVARGRFEATWDAAAGQWNGVWTSAGGPAFPLRLAHGVAPPAPVVEGLDGDWQGAITLGAAGQVRLVFHVRTGADGTAATMDSPDQGANGAPISAVRRAGHEVEIESKLLKAQLSGDLSDDGARIQGEFVQGAMIAPIVLSRTSDLPPAPARSPDVAVARHWLAPPDADIRRLLVRRIDDERRGVGIVVGVISPAGRRVVAYGASDPGEARRVDGDTLFEIGSITKTFTALLLQDMVLKGEVGLDDPVVRYLPPGTVVPSRNGRQITLRELATHTAALPHDLPNATARRAQDVLAMTSEADLWRFLATYQLPRDPGAEWEYSNLGVGLLGVALSRRAGVDLETLVSTRITGPLGMTSTVLVVPPALQARLATGHDAYLRPEPSIVIGPAEAAAGQIRSTANDMLTYLAAELGFAKTPLRPAMAAMLAHEGPGMAGGFRQALGWMLLDTPTGRIVTHSGGTFGHRAFAAFNPMTREGVIVLSNAEGVTGADDIGLHVIAGLPVPALPPAPPPPAVGAARPEQTLSTEAARPYLGRYRLSRSIVMIVGYADGRLDYQVEVMGKAGPVLPVDWHGGEDFSAANGAGDRGDLVFQRRPDGPAGAFTWRGPAGEFVLRRTE